MGTTKGDSGPGALPRIRESGSLAEQATDALLRAVLDRRFQNDRLPPEPELATQMGVSRTTIRSALQSLERLGVVSRAPGRGTRLRPHVGRDSMLLHRLFGFRGILEGRFDDIRVEQKFRVSECPTAPARDALEIDQDTPVLVGDKTYFADGHPAVHLSEETPLTYLPKGVADRLVRGQLRAPGTISEFSRSWDREIDHSVVELVPGVVPRDTSFPIRLKPGTAYLELREIHYAEDNGPLTYAREIVDDDFVRLKLVRTR